MNPEPRLGTRDGLGRRRALLGSAGVALALFGFVAGALFTGPGYGRFAFLYEDFTIESCLGAAPAEALQAPDERRRAVRACFEQLQLQGTLNDFQIRRVNFQTQHVAETVMMWMVVILTLSGVGLAGYQIVAASRLSPEAAPDSELSVERGRLFLRSSITGLFILIVSFGFFFVYIVYVYTIYDLGQDAPLEAVEEGGGAGPELPGGSLLLE